MKVVLLNEGSLTKDCAFATFPGSKEVDITAALFPDSCSLNLVHLKCTKKLSLYVGFFAEKGNVERKEMWG